MNLDRGGVFLDIGLEMDDDTEGYGWTPMSNNFVIC